MANIHLGKLREISDLREIWAHEAKDFTPWLEENIDELGKELGIDVVVTERESSVGDFSVDLYAYDGESGKKIIIENQLEDTDHDHLGKLITYASGKDAALVIWIVKHAREEHRAAIEWLNTHTDEAIGFVLCEIKVYQIGDSALAPKFTVIERPNDWVKNMKTSERQGYKKAVLPKIKDMLAWGVVSEGDTLIAKGTASEATLHSSGKVMVEGEMVSIQKWLKSVYGWSSVETYTFTIQKSSGRSLAQIRSEYLSNI